MDESVAIMAQQVIAMFIMLMAGYAARARNLVSAEGSHSISNLVLYVINPMVILTSLTTTFEPGKLVNLAWCIGLTFAAFALAALISRLGMGKNADPQKANVARYAIIFSNMGFVGIPLVQNVLGTEYVFYVSGCIAAFTFVGWTYGVWLMTGSLEQASPAKVATNPAVIALTIGIVFFVTGWRLPAAVESAVDSLGAGNTGLAMIVLGTYLANTNIKEFLRDPLTLKVCVLRLVVVPLVFVALLAPIPDTVLSYSIKLVLVVTQATPVAGMTAMFADLFGGDSSYGAGLVSITTLVSLVTMPLVLALATAVC